MGAGEIWQQFLIDLENWMVEVDMDPAVVGVIIMRLWQWDKALPINYNNVPPGVFAGVAMQDEIGRNGFLYGRLSYEWEGIQAIYYERLGRHNTGKRWAMKLIQKLQQVLWDMWTHRNGVFHHMLYPEWLKKLEFLHHQIKGIWSYCEEYAPNTCRHLPETEKVNKWLETSCHQWLGIAEKLGFVLKDWEPSGEE